MILFYFPFNILFIHIIFSFTLAYIIYKRYKPFYSPLTYQKSKNSPIIDLNKKYEVFHPKDKLDYLNLVWGCFCFFPLKFFSSLFIALTMKFHLQLINLIYPNSNKDKNQWKKMKFGIQFWSTLFLRANGVRILDKKVNCTEVYKKYLGDDYDFNIKNYSLLINNHIGFFECVALMSRYAAGFMAKEDVANYYFVGPIARAMHCLFVNRESEEKRKQILKDLEERQLKFNNGESFAPLALFPEGTTTCGRNILKFKKGAFNSLLPVKPNIINIYQESDYHLSVGATSVVNNYIKNFMHSVECLYFIDMPVIKPTEFMWKNYSHFGKEKWEIYAEVCRKIMGEIGNLEESELTHRDQLKYAKAATKGIFNGIEDGDEEINYSSSSSTGHDINTIPCTDNNDPKKPKDD